MQKKFRIVLDNSQNGCTFNNVNLSDFQFDNIHFKSLIDDGTYLKHEFFNMRLLEVRMDTSVSATWDADELAFDIILKNTSGVNQLLNRAKLNEISLGSFNVPFGQTNLLYPVVNQYNNDNSFTIPRDEFHNFSFQFVHFDRSTGKQIQPITNTGNVYGKCSLVFEVVGVCE